MSLRQEISEANQNAAAAWKCAVVERDKVCAFVAAWSLLDLPTKREILRALRELDEDAAALVVSTFRQKRYHRQLSEGR
jgi:hypothetical protein